MPVFEDITGAQIERILKSETFQNSEALRRLLRYLGEKTISGEAEHLKEYTIGLDAFGKPPTYDPRQDSSVRLQAGRLRQKLAEYYRAEGKDDTLLIELPKGHFKLVCEQRSPGSAEPVEPAAELVAPVPFVRSRAFELVCAALLVSVGWGIYTTTALWLERKKPALAAHANWTPELRELWEPFIGTNKPLIVAIEDPLFVELRGTNTYYRDKSLNRWSDVLKSPNVAAIRKAFDNATIAPRYYYTDLGGANVAFLLGQLLSTGQQNITLARSSLLYWQQLASNNVLFCGAPWFFDERLSSLPVQPEMVQDVEGIHILHPKPGEPSILADQLPKGVEEDGEVYTLITHTSGPSGATDIETITSNRTPGRVAAIQWFTDPSFARLLLGRLRNSSGRIPRYYQLVLKVKFKDGVPTDTAYVLHRELKASAHLATAVE